MTTNALRQPKWKRVETLRQARTFDSNKEHYVSLGLCNPCAAQAAFGHQLGFSRSKPPCQACRPVVALFSVKEANHWRSQSPRHGAKFSPQLRPRMSQERP
jgi:hypothetical protein